LGGKAKGKAPVKRGFGPKEEAGAFGRGRLWQNGLREIRFQRAW